ncbi:hypothetical protein MYCTH_2310549 [Thermothelomyces thermophilus ATCC 42464]|uniref:C2H2-type domain-containing protein n=1 Tax=Thermothelomyces thermophilus (strain ATCC 42464 / BCRC 31852 / DSM 1799) TaxID=573729 RepID=G2QLN5_THET4|nr:uncharacterized protein MYCTH_2310549 [Thermothelomyces thermophilus ATCC 42464]AEO60865.1 hypothetical protein MYCTH_2310549 [Thermothelomyces thermophilus ATCC 42464]
MEDPANEASGSFGPSHKSPAALEAAFDSAATTRVDTNSTQQTVQNGLPKRVFKMKRTGFSTLPQNTTTRELSSSNAHPPATPGHLAEREPKAVQIISYLPSRISTTPVTGTSVTPSKAQSASSSARKTKYATDEERRKATSIALKQRWASGVMANVHKKRLETIRRRKEAEALLGTPGIAKSSSSVVDLKQATKSSKSLTRLSWVPNSDARQAHEARERPVVSEQFSSNKRRLTAESATSSSHEDLDAQSENSTWLSISSVLDGDQAVEQPSDEDESKSRTNNDASFITMAASDRAYSKWRDERGSLIPTYGALIPEGYKFSTTTPGRPWICPVRSCRKVFAKLRELGSHFNRGHRGAQLHDNEDGTLSERTTGRLRRPSSKLAAPFPAVVISRGPPDPAEAPAVEPSFPTLVPGKQLLGVQDASMLEGNDDIDLDTEGTTNTGDEANIGSAIEESQEATPITTNGVPTNIAEAEPGRPYTMWPDENGELVPTYGSLLPAGYQLDNTIPGRPWVCPVRTCRTSHCKRSDLGFHFMVQ